MSLVNPQTSSLSPNTVNTFNTANKPSSASVYDATADVIPIEQDDIIRLKILIPLATLAALFTNLLSALVLKPSMGEISERFYTLLTPHPIFIGIYWAVLFTLLIGLAFMVVFTSSHRYRTEQTKQLFVNALGLRYVMALFCFAFWPIFWATQLMGIAAAILVIIFGLLLSIHFSIRRHFPPSATQRPFSFLFVHVPLRLFALILWQVDILQTLLIALGWYKIRPGGQWEPHHRAHLWIVFGLVIAIGVVNALMVLIWEDPIWAIGSVWLTAGLLRAGRSPAGKLGEEPLLAITLIGLAVLQVACLAGTIGSKIGKFRQSARPDPGPVRLEEDRGENA